MLLLKILIKNSFNKETTLIKYIYIYPCKMNLKRHVNVSFEP